MTEKRWGLVIGVLLLLLIAAYIVGNLRGEAVNGIAITTFGTLLGVICGGLLASQLKKPDQPQQRDKKVD